MRMLLILALLIAPGSVVAVPCAVGAEEPTPHGAKPHVGVCCGIVDDAEARTPSTHEPGNPVPENDPRCGMLKCCMSTVYVMTDAPGLGFDSAVDVARPTDDARPLVERSRPDLPPPR
jgi:hypothetical protein